MYLQSFHLPLNGATSKAACGAFSPHLVLWLFPGIIYKNHLSESNFGKVLAHPSAPNALPKSPSLSALAQPDVGDCFSPYPCVSLVNSGEAAAASSTSWKLDGSWMEALVPYKQQPRRDRGVTPQAEIPSRPKPPLPARAQHDHGPRSPQGASVCSMPGFPCH